MRDLESIDDELALTSEVRQALLDDGCEFATWQVDPLLDERLRWMSRRALAGRIHSLLRNAGRAVALPRRFSSH